MCFSVTYRIKDFGNFHDENLNCKVEDINVKISDKKVGNTLSNAVSWTWKRYPSSGIVILFK